jgi:prolyl 4-hydroxylase
MRFQIIDGFLSKEECSQIIELARPKLTPSTGWDIKTASARVTDYRTSEQMYFQRGENELVSKIEDRISAMIGMYVEHGEGLQVLRYGVGGHYKTHCDWFDPNYEGNKPVLEHGGQRIATMIMYLNDVQKGGETYFPMAEVKGDLKITPKQGRAFLWWNVKEDGTPDPNTIHEGMDVEEGEKWIMTKWIRERPYV